MTEPITILYIEDDDASRKLVERVLSGHGYRVEVAGNGLEGIERARATHPRLILMDINLPGMDGRAITTRLRSLPNFTATPIIALTASSAPGSRELALAAGCTGYLTKPIDVASFPEQVDDFLHGRVEPLDAQARAQHLERYAQSVVERLEGKVRELEAANLRLRQLDKMKSDFIILVSHELRTPLTLISGYTHLLKQQTDNGQPELERRAVTTLVNGLDKSVARMQEVIVDIINVSRITAGLLELTPTKIKPAEAVARAVNELKPVFTERSLVLEVYDLSGLGFVEGDASQVQLAIENVLGNAIKFTPDGGRIEVNGRDTGSGVEISVRDTGIGIPLLELERVFDQFYVLGSIEHHSTSKSAFRGGGLGLGLAIAKGIVEAHHGWIRAESSGRDIEHPPGSTFTLYFPRRLPTSSKSVKRLRVAPGGQQTTDSGTPPA